MTASPVPQGRAASAISAAKPPSHPYISTTRPVDSHLPLLQTDRGTVSILAPLREVTKVVWAVRGRCGVHIFVEGFWQTPGGEKAKCFYVNWGTVGRPPPSRSLDSDRKEDWVMTCQR